MKRKVLLTETDVLTHSYGVSTPEVVPTPPTMPSPVSPVESVPSVESVPVIDIPPSPPLPVVEDIQVEVTDEVEIVEAVAAAETADAYSIFIDKYTKTELIKIAQDAGLDTIGNKTQLAKRLAEAGIVPSK